MSDFGFLEIRSASPAASWSERGFPDWVLVAPYGVFMDYRSCWSSKAPLAPEVVARGALHRRGFVVGQDLAVPFSEGWLLLG